MDDGWTSNSSQLHPHHPKPPQFGRVPPNHATRPRNSPCPPSGSRYDVGLHSPRRILSFVDRGRNWLRWVL
ncbi:hypothetical protein L226DRAFT_292257 [Lentinus tigrinus ALCF2SS1-7]|uniref:uncharacterized protein n=1 Tax=Lentinus tigrinus ALCF2SS1-7 TaxID=1328758 RepID=UPI0011660592|nr:hypothetical protein L226DRAFT_292257 [Lentinus tigrinus ALCF2SS1-7]